VNDPQNQEPSPQLDEDEFIECFSVPLTNLHDVYLSLARQGLRIDARVGTLWQKELNWRDDGSYSCRH
jgi:ADP-ribose pyrophosphatase